MEDRVKAVEEALKASEAKVSAVSLKLPPFWPSKATLWFAHAEAQFHLRNITVDKTKFAHVLTMLDSTTAEYEGGSPVVNEGGSPFVNEGDC